jgi:hypothetical protein
MLFDQEYATGLEALASQLKNETALTADLIRKVITGACTRFPAMKKAGKSIGLESLIEIGAWCDATLALVEIELPHWSIRRLAHEDGEWFCSLSRQPALPIEFDDTADASHPVLPLAILGAFLEARRRVGAARETRAPTVPQVRATEGYAICSDNFV